MFLDSGNIISDETFCTQSQHKGGKISEFSAESLLPSPDKGREILPKILELFPPLCRLCVQNVSSEILMILYPLTGKNFYFKSNICEYNAVNEYMCI